MSEPISQSTADLKPAGPLGSSPVSPPSTTDSHQPAPPSTSASAAEHTKPAASSAAQQAQELVKRARESSAWYNYWVGLGAQFVLILVVGWADTVSWFMGWFSKDS
ncbi:hypothetical protein CALCODRAFT_505620 [Calocera cornea HHB12733]|uniref:Uncharacterized protein n=1 Tax=Calocera cornea HHB12733 TaxID=1353952 RepID=A0A165JU81_9BASI|nr:hypothetical protein CALCODRAFT_505620 [Calocera cornea HHB12733]